jgi:hypothetical protein
MNMTRVTVDEDTIDMSTRALEAGRRAGWAHAFDALRRADSAEHDVNVLRADVKALCRFAARAYGCLEQTVGRNRMAELFRGDHHEMQGFFPQGALNEGRDAMRRLLGGRADELTRIRAEIAVVKGERHALAERVFTAAKHAELERLMSEFGIPDEGELLGWLARYPQ